MNDEISHPKSKKLFCKKKIFIYLIDVEAVKG